MVEKKKKRKKRKQPMLLRQVFNVSEVENKPRRTKANSLLMSQYPLPF